MLVSVHRNTYVTDRLTTWEAQRMLVHRQQALSRNSKLVEGIREPAKPMGVSMMTLGAGRGGIYTHIYTHTHVKARCHGMSCNQRIDQHL